MSLVRAHQGAPKEKHALRVLFFWRFLLGSVNQRLQDACYASGFICSSGILPGFVVRNPVGIEPIRALLFSIWRRMSLRFAERAITADVAQTHGSSRCWVHRIAASCRSLLRAKPRPDRAHGAVFFPILPRPFTRLDSHASFDGNPAKKARKP